MKCTKCGKELPEGTIFCGYCGAKLPKITEKKGNTLSPAPEKNAESTTESISVTVAKDTVKSNMNDDEKPGNDATKLDAAGMKTEDLSTTNQPNSMRTTFDNSDTMFHNIGDKICGVAKAFFWIGVAISILIGISMINVGSSLCQTDLSLKIRKYSHIITCAVRHRRPGI